MFRRTFISAVLATLVSVAPARADETPEPHAHWCMLAQFQVTQVASLYVKVPAGRGAIKRLVGAQLFVPAQPGLKAEWIRANLSRHTAEPMTHRSYSCPLDLRGVKTNVASGGTGFWIQISSQDSEAAHEILERARRVFR